MSSTSQEGFLWTPQGTHEGLVAARELCQKHNLKVLLLEARDRIGGRTWTAKVLGEDLEMGGTWVHWAQPHVYSELRRYGLHANLKASAGTFAPEKIAFKPARSSLRNISVKESGEILDRVAQAFFTVDGHDSRVLLPYPHDPFREPALWKNYDHWTVQDRLDCLEGFSPYEKNLFGSNVSSFGSAPGKDIAFTEALRWYALGGHNFALLFEMAGVYKLGNGGMTSFARAIMDEFTGDLLFNTAVQEIDNLALGVQVLTTRGERITSKAVISTIPLNCLGDVKFNPPLSSLRQAATAEGHINRGAKIHFKLRDTDPAWSATANGPVDSSFVFAFSDHNGTQLSGPSGTWCIGFGYNSCLTEKRDSKHIINRFQCDIHKGAHVEAYVTHDWMNDPYAKGVWTCWGPNAASRYLPDLQKPHCRVIFASADWADGWRGFVDGAIEQGHQAVRDVVTLLKTNPGALQAKL